MALADEDNRQLLERDLRYAWWNNHCVVDAAIGNLHRVRDQGPP